MQIYESDTTTCKNYRFLPWELKCGNENCTNTTLDLIVK